MSDLKCDPPTNNNQNKEQVAVFPVHWFICGSQPQYQHCSPHNDNVIANEWKAMPVLKVVKSQVRNLKHYSMLWKWLASL